MQSRCSSAISVRQIMARILRKPAPRANASFRRKIALIVVPQPDADLLLEVLIKAVLVRQAVVVVQSRAEQVAALVAAPGPTGLHHEIAAEVEFFPQVPMEREERRATDARRLGRRVIRAELELPLLAHIT